MTEILWADYSWARPDITPFAGVMRYLDDANPATSRPDLTVAEVDAIHGAGKPIGLIWQMNGEKSRASRGFEIGELDARTANAKADELGATDDVAIFYTVDFDAQPAQVEAYVAGVRSVPGRPVGIYGSARIVDWATSVGIEWRWQTKAWSSGVISPNAHLYQRDFLGDLDRSVLFAPFPSWRPDVAGYRSYTAAEYRAAGINAGPFALEWNPDQNYRTNRRKPILGIVMHITAGLTDYDLPDSSAEGTTKYGMTTARDASWHVCIDSDGIIPSVRDAFTAWHAGISSDYWSHPARPYINDATLGVEQGTSQVDWRRAPAAWVERTLRNDAVWLAPRVKRYGIPLTVIRDRNVMGDAIMAGRPFGFISHATIAPHNRRDPGIVDGVDTYPWAQLFQYVRDELAGSTTTPPPMEDDMTLDEFKAALTNDSELRLLLGRAVLGYKNTSVSPADAFQNIVNAANPGRVVEALAADAALIDTLSDSIAAKVTITGTVTKADVEDALRSVLGGLDNAPAAG